MRSNPLIRSFRPFSGSKRKFSSNLFWPALSLALALTGCASVPMKEGGTLTSYANLGDSEGRLSKRRLYVDRKYLAAAKTASIVPTNFVPKAASRVKSQANRSLVSNALDRALCVALSEKYRMVPTGQPADLVIRSAVTDVVPTNKSAAGIATAVSVGGGLALPVDVPFVGIPRLPIGLGGLAVEAEAVDSDGVQRAAMVWARGANSIQDAPRYSKVGDAYGLASTFASDFSELLISGEEPKMLSISLPSGHQIRSWAGGKPKYAACEAFGRMPGLFGTAAASFGLPPQWTDKKPEAGTVR